ncbi:MAG: hypothetical protein PHQ19_00955 [Candidatus Krumholzibacteria bacterium]|nr:hypothetical protein [Candidatus Krumholzibacteria bacterium]
MCVFASREGGIELPHGWRCGILAAGYPFENITGIASGPGGYLYIIDNGDPVIQSDSRLIRLNSVAGTSEVLLQDLPLATPRGIMIGDGSPLVGDDVLVADFNTDLSAYCCNGRVFRIDPETGSWSVLAAGNPEFDPPGDPAGLALGPHGGFDSGLYVMDFMGISADPPVLYRLDDDGSAHTFLTRPDLWTTDRMPGMLVFGPAQGYGGDLFIGDWATVGGAPCIWRLASWGDLSIFAASDSLAGLSDMAFSPGGVFGSDLFALAVHDTGASVFRIDGAGSLSQFAGDIPSGAQMLSLKCGAIEFIAEGDSLIVGCGDTLYAFDRLEQTGDAVTDPARGILLDVRGPVPSGSRVEIRFSLPRSLDARIVVFDVAGRKIKSLVSAILEEGSHSIDWDGTSGSGGAVASGVDFVRLETSAGSMSRRVVIMR